jgi:pimeloyl-ACP methyl ester carboxylesterase
MSGECAKNYAALDVPEVLTRLFYPRPEVAALSLPTAATELLVPVEPGVVLGGRFYAGGAQQPTLLFFHGNGEIVADYEELGPVYNQWGLNFLPVDYRGYGRSTGVPTVTAMLRDCQAILDFTLDWLGERGFSGPLVVMGRSLGSACALELAARRPGRLDGLIVESGFAYIAPLLELLGVNVQALGFQEEAGCGNLDKIRQWVKPLLVIHAELDQIIPCAEGQALYDASPSPQKTLLKVAGAGHNDILPVGFTAYLKAVTQLASLAARQKL